MTGLRILFVNDGIGDPGGVQSYLAAAIPGLAARGHQIALLHVDRLRPGRSSPAAGMAHFCIAEEGPDAAVAAALRWRPDVVFSHNFRPLDVERALMAVCPVVKMMHGYFGTCIGGQKAHLSPRPSPCGRRLGVSCLVLYGPRQCGSRSPGIVTRAWGWAREQQESFGRYQAIVTASGHMRDEFVRNGAPADLVHTVPLFPTLESDPGPTLPPPSFRVVFLGRMTRLKGGDLLIRAVAEASRDGGAPMALTMAGDGPRRSEWQALADSLEVDAEFVGWVEGEARLDVLRRASVLAVPSVWPEPFGLAGPEAGVAGVPAVAFDVGGIREWLTDGVNGLLVAADPPTVSALADALRRVCQDRAGLERLGAGARRVALRLSAAAHLDRLEELLLIAADRPAPQTVIA